VKDFAEGLAPLGTPQSFVQVGQSRRGGMTGRTYLIRFPQRAIRALDLRNAGWKVEQYQIATAN